MRFTSLKISPDYISPMQCCLRSTPNWEPTSLEAKLDHSKKPQPLEIRNCYMLLMSTLRVGCNN